MCKVFPFIRPLSFGLLAYFDAFQLFYIGEVHIETSQRWQSFFQNLTGNLADIRPRRFEIRVRIVTAKRVTDRGNSFEATFNYHSHRTGIVYIHGRIISMIDTADYQIRFAVEYCMEGKLHTVYRRTGTFVNRKSYVFTYQLIMNRFGHCQRTCIARTRCIRRHYYDFSQRTEKLYQLTNTFRNDSIVIGY